MHIRALANPISFPGFHTLLRGESCAVPEGFEIGAQRHVDRGVAEWVDEPASSAAPPPDPASAEETTSTPATAPAVPDEAAEEARLLAELESLDSSPPAGSEIQQADGKKAIVNCASCGLPYQEHAKNSTAPNDALECKGLRKGFKPPAAVTE